MPLTLSISPPSVIEEETKQEKPSSHSAQHKAEQQQQQPPCCQSPSCPSPSSPPQHPLTADAADAACATPLECPQRWRRRLSSLKQSETAVAASAASTACQDGSSATAAASDLHALGRSASAASAAALPSSHSSLLPSSLLSLQSSKDVGIILADRLQQITHVNSTFSAITGYSRQDSIGRNCSFLQGAHTSSQARLSMRAAIARKETCQVAVLNYRKNGQAFWVKLTIAPMLDGRGRVELFVGLQEPHSVLYVDRPMPLFPWRRDSEALRESNSAPAEDDDDDEEGSAGTQAAAKRSKHALTLYPAKPLTHTRSMDFMMVLESEEKAMEQSAAAAVVQEEELELPPELVQTLPHIVELAEGAEESMARPPHQQSDDPETKPEGRKDDIEQLSRHMADIHLSSAAVPSSSSSSPASFSPSSSSSSTRKALAPALSRATPVSFIAETLLPTLKGKYRVRAYQDQSPLGLLERREILVIMYGDVQAAASSQSGLPLRVHDACFTSEVLGSLKCDCRQQLDWALDFIQHNALHAGLVIYLSQEGRGIGLANKIKAYSLQERGYDTVDANRMLGFADDLREYSCVPSILDDLQVRAVRLMTNNPRKTESLASLGVNVVGRIPVVMPSNEHSAGYLNAKRQRMGHHEA